MEIKRITPLKAIRLKCLDCCCGSPKEVKLCTVEKCPLHSFREGHNPYIEKRELTEEQREAAAARLAQGRIVNKRGKTQSAHTEGVYIPEE